MKLAVTLVFLLGVSLVSGSTYLNSKLFAHASGSVARTAVTSVEPAAPQDKKMQSRTMPGKMVLDDEDAGVTMYAGDKGKVDFDHDQHAALDTCVTCHHTNTNKLTKAVEEDVMKCAVCHKDEETECETEGTNEDRKFKGKTAISSEDAFHGTGSPDRLAGCIDCHKARKDKPKAQAFTKCAECHKK